MKYKEYILNPGVEKDDFSEYEVTVPNINSLSDFNDFSFENLSSNVELFFKIDGENELYLDWVMITKSNDEISALCFIFFQWDTWKNPYNIKECIQELSGEFNNNGVINEIDDNYSEGVGISYTLKSISGVKDLCEINKSVIYRCIKNACEKCLEKTKGKILVKVFDFPEHYKTACTQYMVWFGEFLKTLDMRAEVSIDNSDGKTTLLVSSEYQFRERLEQALYTYLSLPDSEIYPIDTSDVESKVNYQLMVSQVQNLKTQIELKESIIEMKNATIEATRKELMLLSSIKDEKSIDIVNGLSVTDYQWGIFKFKPSEVLKKYLTKNENQKQSIQSR